MGYTQDSSDVTLLKGSLLNKTLDTIRRLTYKAEEIVISDKSVWKVGTTCIPASLVLESQNK